MTRESNPAWISDDNWFGASRLSQAQTLDLTARVVKNLAGTLSQPATGDTPGLAAFRLDLGSIRVQGADDVPVALVYSTTESTVGDLTHFCRGNAQPGRFSLIFCPLPQIEQEARDAVARYRCVVLGARDMQKMLATKDAKPLMKEKLRASFSRLSLIPYDIDHPAQPHLFYGRKPEMERLLQQATASFAIAGPPGLGKTSLVRHYLNQLVARRDPRAEHRFYLNFLQCNNLTEDGIASFVAMKIAPSRRSYYMKAPDGREQETGFDFEAEQEFKARLKNEGLLKFLHRQYGHRGHPLELVLDEVDLVCRSKVFEILGECARQNLCRLIICGRSALLQMMKNSDGALRRRLHLIRMKSLSDEEARDLIFEPLGDLGIAVESPEEFLASLTTATGKFPHMLQYYGVRLVERAEETGKSTLTPKDVDAIVWDLQTRLFVMGAVKSIKDPTLKKVALILLDNFRSARPEHWFKPLAVTLMVRPHGINLEDPELAEDICDELVIENVLAWEDGVYRLANETLPLYAESTGLLSAAKASA